MPPDLAGFFSYIKVMSVMRGERFLPVVAWVFLSLMVSACEEGGLDSRALKATLEMTELSARADAGEAQAQYELALMYEYMQDLPDNDSQALKWYKHAAEQGHSEAQYNLGQMYDKGQGVAQNHERAVFWYEQAAEQGAKRAQYNLGEMYAHGRGVIQDDAQAIYWYKKSAERVTQDDFFLPRRTAIRSRDYSRLAEQNYADAHYQLGWMYANKGRAVPAAQDDERAFFWYQKSALRGVTAAQFNLGRMYVHGQGVTQNHERAVFWYRKAAEQDHPAAQTDLAFMYYHGQGVAQDYEQAVFWFHKAAKQGHDKAQYRLGWMYANGFGVGQDHQKERAWHEKAAKQGHHDAQKNLGFIYALGQGTEQDFVRATAWLNIAATHRDPLARKVKKMIAQKMTPNQISEAQKLSWQLFEQIAQ